jgi:hypothetical protein
MHHRLISPADTTAASQLHGQLSEATELAAGAAAPVVHANVAVLQSGMADTIPTTVLETGPAATAAATSGITGESATNGVAGGTPSPKPANQFGVVSKTC